MKQIEILKRETGNLVQSLENRIEVKISQVEKSMHTHNTNIEMQLDTFTSKYAESLNILEKKLINTVDDKLYELKKST